MGERFGNYEILRRLAAGGMAEVLLAKQQGLGGFERLVCLKRILPHLSGQDEFLKMFQDEARIAANLIHPNVAQIYDIGITGEHYYIAMEYVRGEDLRRVYNQEVTQGHSIPGHVAACIIMGAAAGLHYAHRQTALDGSALGIVHRDVSPQNILVTYDGHVKLIDFGVAKAAGKLNQTRAGVLKGKYSYMSPEQASGDPVDARTDIFALGTTLYEITTGTRLFKRDNELETLHAVIACNVPRPTEVVPGYDADLEAIVLKALAYDTGSRYQTAGELESDLELYLHAHRYSTSASSLASYMAELFAEKLADEALLGGAPWSENPTPPATRQAPVAKGDDEKTTVDLSPDSVPATLPTPRATPTPTDVKSKTSATASSWNATPSEWHVSEAVEMTSSTRSAEVDDQASFLPLQEAEQIQQEADAAWREIPPVNPSRAPTLDASNNPRERRGRPRKSTFWGTRLSALVVVVAATGLVLTGLFGGTWLQRRGLEAQRLPNPSTAATSTNPTQAPSTAAVAPPSPPTPALPPVPTHLPVLQTRDPKPIPPGMAGLDVTAPLPMAVTLGGHYLGETPLFGVAVAPGSLHVKMENRQEGLTVWRRLRLAKHQSRRVRIDEARGQLRVASKPWAWVQRGLYPATETPRSDSLVVGDYLLTLECPDGRRHQQTVAVRPDETTEVNFNCE